MRCIFRAPQRLMRLNERVNDGAVHLLCKKRVLQQCPLSNETQRRIKLTLSCPLWTGIVAFSSGEFPLGIRIFSAV